MRAAGGESSNWTNWSRGGVRSASVCARLALGVACALIVGCVSYGEAGDRAAAAGDWDRAVTNYERAFDAQPQSVELGRKLATAKRNAARVHRETASDLRSSGRFAEAIDEFQISLRYDADPTVEALLEQTRTEKRRADAERALTDAAVAAREGRLVDAVGLYERSAELDEAFRSATERPLRELRARIREAEETARRARAEACPGAAAELAEVLAARAAAEADAGETSRAIDHYREAIEVDPTAVSNFVAAGSLLLAEGQTDAAVALLADGLERHPDDRALRNLMVAALTIR